MKKFLQKAVSVVLCVAISASMLVLPASAVSVSAVISALSKIESAAGAIKALAEATSSVAEMVSDLKEFLSPSTPNDSSMWIAASYWGGPDGHRCELVSKTTLELISQDWNANYSKEVGFSTDVVKRDISDGRVFYVIRCLEVGGRRGEQNMEYYLCDGNARILCVDDTVTPTEYDGTWLPIQTLKSPYTLVSYADLNNTALAAGGKIQKSGNLYFILNSAGTRYYATPSGLAYAYMPPEESASGSDRPTDSVIEVGGDGSENTVTVDGDNTKIDIENGIFTGLDGTLQIIDVVIYDESTKTYYIDSHDSYTSNTYNYYTYQYYINYTSITYIGYTEQYDKHYEVYYKLPDGRSSADLTAEELEQLNLSIDVINYGRSADDVSLRSLYHFDGDTDDSSYWNYCTSFTWNKGASLTYMDEGTFGGSLYLDETEHDFTLTLPSAISSLDFTLQWRMYQSHTEAPQTDSYVNIGDVTFLKFDGANILRSSGVVAAAMPVGTWNEIAIMRSNGVLYYYLNGVQIGSASNSTAFSNKITFHFGSGQQTFKKLDELRVLNRALQADGASYTPTSVPHDTNLALVLPDSATPVADEYWVFTSSHDNIIPLTADSLTQGFAPLVGAWILPADSGNSGFFAPTTGYGSMEYLPGCLRVTRTKSAASNVQWSDGFRSCFNVAVATGYYDAYRLSSTTANWTDSFVFTIVTSSGEVCSVPFTMPFVINSGWSRRIAQTFDWGEMGICRASTDTSGTSYYYLYVEPTTSVDIVYMELIRGTSTDLTAEHVTSITPMTPEDLATPTLAVRSDIPVTTWQIGGVRPSVPTKGQVWALVERQYITSLQIYNGRAWEACDGRIWTGSRWVPYSSYNVITLKDMSDIVDGSSPDKEYIYTETGFWDWWQRSWNAFTTKFFSLLEGGSGGLSPGGSGSIVSGSVAESLKNALSSLIDGLFGVIQTILEVLLAPVKNLLTFVSDLFTDSVFSGITDFFSAFGGDGSLWDFFQQEGEDGSSTVGLPSEIGVAFGFFSGVLLALPSDLRFVLFFGVGLMVFFSILKLAKE